MKGSSSMSNEHLDASVERSLLAAVEEVLAELHGRAPAAILLGTDLAALGVDSLILAEILVRLEDTTDLLYGLDIGGTPILTVSDLLEALVIE